MQPYIATPESEAGDTNMIFDHMTWEGGAKVYFKGYPYPAKGYLTQDKVWAVNTAKECLKYPYLWPIVGKIAYKAMQPYLLKREYRNDFANEIETLIGGKLGELIANILEYDNAYRLRFQDLFSEATKESLAAQPIREILRLLAINKRRDLPDVHAKLKYAAYFLILVLLWPPFRSQFKKAINQSNFTNLQLDESDDYWLKIRTDYKANL